MKTIQYTENEQTIRRMARQILRMVDDIHNHPHTIDTSLFQMEEATKWINFYVKEIREKEGIKIERP